MGISPRQLNEMAKLCTGEEAPHCTAACPLHVDVRGLAGAAAKGSFTAARTLLEKTVFFPHLLSLVCDHPCTGGCIRGSMDTPVQIQLLERACLAFGMPDARPFPKPAKKQRTAVVGCGLGGLFAAAALLKKGYPVTMFERSRQPGGRLCMEADKAEALRQDLPVLQPADMQMETVITAKELAALTKRFDAVCVACGAGSLPDFSGVIGAIHPFTLQSQEPNLFVCGGMLGADTAKSVSARAESGVRAANSMERFLQGVSLEANRTKEGAYESRLFTDLDGAEMKNAVIPGREGYTREQASAEAARCMECRCKTCQKGCVYLQEFDRYSGNSIRSVVKNVNVISGWGQRDANQFIYSCTLCGQCGARCPGQIDMGTVNLNARRFMWEKGILPPAVHEFPLRDMRHGIAAAPSPRHQQGYGKSRYVLFFGCQLPASMPDTLMKLYGVLAGGLEGGIGLLAGCCGAPAEWAGREQEAKEIREKLRDDWVLLGRPEILVCCPGCYKALREGSTELPLRFITEILPALLPSGQKASSVYAYHDPCASRNYPEIQESGRNLAACLGAELKELSRSRAQTECCGYGGLQYHVNSPLAQKTAGTRASQSPLPFLTSCSNCRDFFRSGGKECLHLLELAFGPEETKGSSPWAWMDFSRRRKVREQFYQDLCERFWQEEHREMEDGMQIGFDGGVQEKMHEQCMLEEDIRRILREAERSGRRMKSGESGRLVAGGESGYLTYWVEYTVRDDGVYQIHNCYTHRMKIIKNPSKGKKAGGQ